jgi:hypothetical protein
MWFIEPKINNRSGVLPYFKGGVAFSAQYQAVLTEATAQGYTLPSAGQQVKQNTLMTSLISTGVFAKLDTLFVLANDGGASFACINWKNPSGTKATLVSSPTFTSNAGFNSNGSSSYIDTNFNAATQGVNFTNNSASEFAYQLGGNFGSVFGTSGGAGDAVVLNTTVGQRLNMSGTNLTVSADMSGNGFKLINRTSATNAELFNETTQISRITTTANRISATRRILNGQNVFLDTSSRVSIYGNGASLVSEALTLRTAIITYLTSL